MIYQFCERMGLGTVSCPDMLSGLYNLVRPFYEFFGPTRFWLIVASVIYGSIYSARLYSTGMRKAHEFHALGLPMSVQGSANQEFSERFARREPLMLIYVASMIVFVGCVASRFFELGR